ncbi:MAG: TPM domain-containing protein [Chitinophagaceae bacterium]|nr:TPM domain-containing protein [Chitinophagaceae bacterium]
MNLISPFRKKDFFSHEENSDVVEAIRKAEQQTSGEIRVFIESRCRFVDPLDRASEIFWNLKMDYTEFHNSVLLYVAIKDHQFAIFADTGIHEKLGDQYWQQQVSVLGKHFSNDHYTQALVKVIHDIGQALSRHFPYNSGTDRNELPDDIVFGK